MGTFISHICHFAKVLVPATVYSWSLQFLTSLKLGHCSKLNWPKRSLHFIGSLGHYFTPAAWYGRPGIEMPVVASDTEGLV